MADPIGRILIVDDNKVNRLLLSRNVELQGHRFATAENGRIALEKLRSEPFDLLLLDIEMPEMNGFAVLEQLKADPLLRDISVIVTSSLEGLDNIVRCISLGAEDYLPKPPNPVLLKARISASLEKKRLRDEQRELVRRFATSEVAQDLQQSGFALGGKRVRMSAWIRTAGVSEAGGTWFRADMPNGAAAVIDNTTFRAPIRGTTDWTRVEIVLDIPATAVMLAYGGILQGAGSLWIDDVQFEIVDPSVPVTAFDPRWSERGSNLSLLDAPGNLSYEE